MKSKNTNGSINNDYTIIKLFNADDQIPLLRFALFALSLAAVLALNEWLRLLPRAALFNLAVIASVQLFFNPRRISSPKQI